MTETVQQDEWTEDNCINLIEEFKKRPMLWDPKHDLYFKKYIKSEMWREISEAIGIPSKACRHKMIVLMSSFRREKYKILQSLRPASPNSPAKKPYKSSWFAFRRLIFIIDKTARGNDLNEQDAEWLKEEMRIMKETLIEHSVDCPVYKKKKPNKPAPVVDLIDTDDAVECAINAMPPEEAIIHLEDESSDDGVTMNPLVNTDPATPASPPPRITETDEISSFVSFIASKMRKYSEETKNEVQEAICEIIFRADNKKNIDKRNPTPQTSGNSLVTETEYPNLFSALIK